MTVAFILTYVDFRLSRPNRLFYACEKGLGCLDSISAFILTYVDFRLSRPNRLFYACEKGLGCLDSISQISVCQLLTYGPFFKNVTTCGPLPIK